MTSTRACSPCRSAKARCDRVRPACGRCRLRGLVCTGLQTETDYMFRDETVVAQQNSERARRSPRRGRMPAVSFEIILPQRERHHSLSPGTTTFLDLKQLYPWLTARLLAKAPAPPERDIETRAIERFFVNWTLHPLNDGTRPGYMNDLPLLYAGAPPDSILWFAVRAVAFAGIRHLSTGDGSTVTKALRNYGSALNQLRIDVEDEQRVSSDDVLAGLLLIDDFESIFLARTMPLGPHYAAFQHILRARGYDQFTNRSRFSLWRVAHHRLQARQILVRGQPAEEQTQWLNNLDTNTTALHIAADVQQMSVLASSAKKLTSETNFADPTLSERYLQAQNLRQSITDFLASTEEWIATMSGTWKPEDGDPDRIVQPNDLDDPPDIPIPHFTCPNLLHHHDIWSAEKLVFHAASQIVLRESLVDVINYAASLQSREPDQEDDDQILSQRLMVDNLSSTIIRTFPQLLGFVQRDSQEAVSPAQGKMIGRFFSLFPLEIVQRARFTTESHKETASEVVSWITSSYGLGRTQM